MKSIRDDLLKEINEFLTKHKMAPATLGRDALGDMGFVLRLRAGRDIRIGTADRVRAYMRTYMKPKRTGGKRKDKADPSKAALASAA